MNHLATQKPKHMVTTLGWLGWRWKVGCLLGGGGRSGGGGCCIKIVGKSMGCVYMVITSYPAYFLQRQKECFNNYTNGNSGWEWFVYYAVQLNKWQTDPYFFQNFQCNTMLIHAFCKTSDQKIVFVLTFVVFSRLYSIGNFVIQLHTCLQRGFDSILQYLNFTFLSHFLFWFVEQLYGRNSDKTRE